MSQTKPVTKVDMSERYSIPVDKIIKVAIDSNAEFDSIYLVPELAYVSFEFLQYLTGKVDIDSFGVVAATPLDIGDIAEILQETQGILEGLSTVCIEPYYHIQFRVHTTSGFEKWLFVGHVVNNDSSITAEEFSTQFNNIFESNVVSAGSNKFKYVLNDIVYDSSMSIVDVVNQNYILKTIIEEV